MPLDAECYGRQKKPLDSVINFLTVTVKDLGWGEGRDEVVMDIGCGPGNVTTKWVLPLFPNLKKMIALDLLPAMIEWAKTKNAHPKVEYYVINFEDNIDSRFSIDRWYGQVDKVVCIHCFNWLKDQRKAFQKTYDVLKPGGEAAIYFELQSYFYNATLDIIQDPKWKKCFEGVDIYVPESHLNKYTYSNYKKMIEDIGFTVLFCQDKEIVNVLPSDEEAKGLYYSVSALSNHVPENRTEEFKDDYYQYVLKHNGRNEDGLPLHRAVTLVLVLRK